MFGSTQFCVGGGFSGLHGSVQAVSAQHCLALGFFRGGILAPRGFGLAWFGASGFGSTRFGVGFFPGLHWDVQGFVGPMDSRGVYAGRLCLRYLFQ